MSDPGIEKIVQKEFNQLSGTLADPSLLVFIFQMMLLDILEILGVEWDGRMKRRRR